MDYAHAVMIAIVHRFSVCNDVEIFLCGYKHHILDFAALLIMMKLHTWYWLIACGALGLMCNVSLTKFIRHLIFNCYRQY